METVSDLQEELGRLDARRKHVVRALADKHRELVDACDHEWKSVYYFADREWVCTKCGHSTY